MYIQQFYFETFSDSIEYSKNSIKNLNSSANRFVNFSNFLTRIKRKLRGSIVLYRQWTSLISSRRAINKTVHCRRSFNWSLKTRKVDPRFIADRFISTSCTFRFESFWLKYVIYFTLNGIRSKIYMNDEILLSQYEL